MGTLALLSACSSGPGAHAGSTPAPGPTGTAPGPPGSTGSPGTITGAATPGALDAVATASLLADGSPGPPQARFDSAASRVYVVAAVSGLPVGTKISYTRYLDNHYIDSRTSALGNGARFFHFIYEANPGKRLVPGHYLVRLYVNERSVNEVSYTIGT
ncbi:MAG: hypothetical protein NVS3B24_23980 [Candidatus Dormibacteria bacterium]